MENYNLTAELKKIASGITTSDPNTELGNINSGVGNLDAAMQGVATAINGISIPNTGSNIDGVATAIGNISIPNTGSNIDGVATAIGNISIPDTTTALGNIVTALQQINIQAIATDSVAVNGSRWNPAGNYVADLDLFWEGIGHVNTSTLHHPQGSGHGIVIAARNGAGAIQIYIPIDAYTDHTDPTVYMRFTQYADLGNWVNPWDYLYLDSYYMKYTDNNNIGATDVQGAIDKLSGYTSGDVSLNGTYFSGYGSWQKVGKHVSVFLEISTIANLPNTNWATKLITNLPPIRTHNNGAKKFNLMARDLSHKPITLAATNSSGYDNTAIYSWDNNGVTSGGSYLGSFDYFTN